MENSEQSSKKSTDATEKREGRPSNSSNEAIAAVTQIAPLSLALDETGSFRICTPPDCAKQTAEVLKRLPQRDSELWCRRFTPSCIERILTSQSLDRETRAFYLDVQQKLKEQ